MSAISVRERHAPHTGRCAFRAPSVISDEPSINMPLSSAGQNSMCANNMETADPAAVNCCCPNRRKPDNHLSDAQRNRATNM